MQVNKFNGKQVNILYVCCIRNSNPIEFQILTTETPFGNSDVRNSNPVVLLENCSEVRI